MNATPVLYFPTHFVFVDDNRSFLETMEQMLTLHGRRGTFISNARKAKEFFDMHLKSASPVDLHLYSQEELEKTPSMRLLGVDVYGLHKEIYSKNRFDTISTLIVDYDMPGMDGLELLQQVNAPYIKKVLLTGAADESVAIQAFNKGLINQYVRKPQMNFNTFVSQTLEQQERAYFSDISTTFQDTIRSYLGYPSAISDPAFIAMFYELVKKYNIIEYYLLESRGSYVMLDNEGKHYELFVFMDDQMDMYAEAAADMEGPEDIIQALKERTHGLCYYNADHPTIPDVAKWKDFLRPVTKLEGNKQNYYYAVASNQVNFDPTRIISYKEFKTGVV